MFEITQKKQIGMASQIPAKGNNIARYSLGNQTGIPHSYPIRLLKTHMRDFPSYRKQVSFMKEP